MSGRKSSVAAILSAFALIGIAASLILQSNQIKISHQAVSRERHFDLVKLVLDDPSLDVTSVGGFEGEELRQTIAANLWVTYWKMQWELGEFPETTTYRLFSTLFSRPVPYRWWTIVGPNWGTTGTRVEAEFLGIANRAHRDAVLPEPDPQPSGQPTEVTAT
ncbi:DUF6082 family protein [Cryptosporangium sp. NPDC048952]|uniref:DUF6082 family protein n=1 Tax=Cryptosporangium sp. NPDC048952 TaxID=3363961 RepID=UPI0037143A9B